MGLDSRAVTHLCADVDLNGESLHIGRLCEALYTTSSRDTGIFTRGQGITDTTLKTSGGRPAGQCSVNLKGLYSV